jgi:hypothetical protein
LVIWQGSLDLSVNEQVEVCINKMRIKTKESAEQDGWLGPCKVYSNATGRSCYMPASNKTKTTVMQWQNF